MSGLNGCVFAYGATGTGKTHTMLGNQSTNGLCILALKDVFATTNQQSYSDSKFAVKVCYVEIYNEAIRDLLDTSKSPKYIDLRDDPSRGVEIAGVTEFEVKTEKEVPYSDQIIGLLHQGNRRRTTEATNANQTSSRSHAVFQVLIARSERVKNTVFEVNHSKLSLIDLAGSERGTSTGNRGIRMMEGAKINRSLLALGNCINALGDKNKKGSFVPYRDSKLTRLLKDSLGGNCKTVMIVTISPSETQFEDTLNTLKYANRAKNIRTKAVENKTLVEMHIAEYKNIIEELRGEVDQLKTKLHRVSSDTFLTNISKAITNKCEHCAAPENSEKVREVQEALFDNFQERIQLRRALCEIEAQNQLNFMEIDMKNQAIMLITSEGFNHKEKMADHVQEIDVQLNDINTLKTSTDFNHQKKHSMTEQLKKLAEEASIVVDKVAKGGFSAEEKRYLELVVQNHVFELQNNELEINLNLRAKMNKMLSEKLMDMKKELTDNGVVFDSDDEKEEEMVRQYQQMRNLRKLGGSPHPSSNPHIHYPPISAKKVSGVQNLTKFHEVNRIKRIGTVEKINQSRGNNDGSTEIEKSRGDTLRKPNRYGHPVRLESHDPYKQIEINGSNYLKKFPPYKPVLKPSNSPPRQEYKKEEGVKDELPQFNRGKVLAPKGQENKDSGHNHSGLGVLGAGIQVTRDGKKPQNKARTHLPQANPPGRGYRLPGNSRKY